MRGREDGLVVYSAMIYVSFYRVSMIISDRGLPMANNVPNLSRSASSSVERGLFDEASYISCQKVMIFCTYYSMYLT